MSAADPLSTAGYKVGPHGSQSFRHVPRMPSQIWVWGNFEVTSIFKAICHVPFAVPEQLWGCCRMRCAAGDPLLSGCAGAREAGLALHGCLGQMACDTNARNKGLTAALCTVARSVINTHLSCQWCSCYG